MTTTASPPSSAASWRNRIVGTGEESPADLVANPKNWRIHPQAQQEALASVLDKVGWVGQVLVNQRSHKVVDGHLRVALAISRQEPSVPVLYVDLTDEEERLVLASLDPISAMAATDDEKLRELLDSIPSFDSAALEAQIVSFLAATKRGRTEPDDVPDVPAEPYVKAGELWILGEHRLLCGDATDADDVARLVGGSKLRLLVADPPYGVSLDPTWRDGIYNGLGPAEKPYMRIAGHRNTTLSGDTRVYGPRPSRWSPACGPATSGTLACTPQRLPRASCASASRSWPR